MDKELNMENIENNENEVLEEVVDVETETAEAPVADEAE